MNEARRLSQRIDEARAELVQGGSIIERLQTVYDIMSDVVDYATDIANKEREWHERDEH